VRLGARAVVRAEIDALAEERVGAGEGRFRPYHGLGQAARLLADAEHGLGRGFAFAGLRRRRRAKQGQQPLTPSHRSASFPESPHQPRLARAASSTLPLATSRTAAATSASSALSRSRNGISAR